MKIRKSELLRRIVDLEERLQVETSEPKPEIDYRSYVGKNMFGFEFNTNDDCIFNPHMNRYIGEKGLITDYDLYDNTFKVNFSDGFWCYHANLAIQHIAEETENTNTDHEEKIKLYTDMLNHAKEVNGDWLPDWENDDTKHGIELWGGKTLLRLTGTYNCLVFGIAYKTQDLAKEALSLFKDRIEKCYGN